MHQTRIIFRVRLIYFIITTFLISDWRMSTWTMLASTVHSSQCLYPSITTKMKIKMSDAILGYNMDLLFDLISSFSFLKHLFAPSFILSFFICWEFKCKNIFFLLQAIKEHYMGGCKYYHVDLKMLWSSTYHNQPKL